MSSTEPSIFRRIIDRDIPADIVAENDRLIAFADINPQAAVHVLVVPKTEAYANVAEVADGDPQLLADMVGMAREIAEQHGGDFRLVFNSGAGAGQTVFHVHAHVLIADAGEESLAEGTLGEERVAAE